MSEYKVYKHNQDFDFFNDTLPENSMFFAFGDQLERARTLLKHRTTEEIHYIIESLDWMLHKAEQIEFSETMLMLKQKDSVFTNRVKALKLFSDRFDISNQSNLPNATWVDYFSGLALITVLEALHPDNLAQNGSIGYELPMEALEAVCIAEFQKELAQQEQLNLKARGSKGGKVRAEKFGILKNKILNAYKDNPRLQNQSNRQAARALMEEFKDDITNTLSNAEPRETLERWIGKYKKTM